MLLGTDDGAAISHLRRRLEGWRFAGCLEAGAGGSCHRTLNGASPSNIIDKNTITGSPPFSADGHPRQAT